MGVRNAQIIGDLWPRCQTCGHIAQAHDKAGCSEPAPCPHCGRLDHKVKCACKEYVGPTLLEFMDTHMTQEERDYYGPIWRV